MAVEHDWLLVQSSATPEGRGGCATGIDVKSVFGHIVFFFRSCSDGVNNKRHRVQR